MYREQLDAWIDGKKDEMLEDLKTLVRINSQKGEPLEGKPFGEGPAAAVAAAQRLMEKYGLKVTNYDNYVIAGDLSDAPKGLDILAHLDVVPVTPEDWTVTQPFEPRILDGRIYGRGTADDKGPAVAALYALRALKELNVPLKKSVRLVLGSDEECGSADLRHYFSIEQEAPYTFTPDADFPLINIEKGTMTGDFSASFADGDDGPRVLAFRSGDKKNVVPARASMTVEGLTGEQIADAVKETEAETGVKFTVTEECTADQKPEENPEENPAEKIPCAKEAGPAASGGSLPRLHIDARGLAAHASTPQDGKNALTASLRLISRLPLADTSGYRALCALNRLTPFEDTCGKALGIYREEERSGALTLCFSILTYTPKQLHGVFDARLPIGCTDENTMIPAAEAFEAQGLRFERQPIGAPHCVPGDSGFVKILLDSYERYTGIHGAPLSTGGGTYVHHLERGVAFGCMTPDVDNHMHGDDEFMAIDTLVMSAKIFADAIVRICNEL